MKDRSQSVETFSDELKRAIRRGLPPVEDNALVNHARYLIGGTTMNPNEEHAEDARHNVPVQRDSYVGKHRAKNEDNGGIEQITGSLED